MYSNTTNFTHEKTPNVWGWGGEGFLLVLSMSFHSCCKDTSCDGPSPYISNTFVWGWCSRKWDMTQKLPDLRQKQLHHVNPPPIHMYCIKLAPVTIGWGRGRVTWCSLVFPQQRAVFPTQCSEFKLCSNATQLQSEALEVSQRHLCWFYKWLVNGFKSTKKEKPRNTFFSWIPDLILGLLCGYKKYQLKHLHWQCQTADHRSSLSV